MHEQPEIKPQETEGKYRSQFKEIAELEEPIKIIIEKMGDEIYDYRLVLGVDASGRIPTLIIGRFLKEICKPRDQEVDIKFLAGRVGRGDVIKYINDLELDRSSRVLVVDESINSGASIIGILEALNEIGQPFSVASVGCIYGTDEKIVKNKVFGSANSSSLNNSQYRIYIGQKEVPDIYSKGDLAGVEKDRYAGALHPHIRGRPPKEVEIEIKSKIKDFEEALSKKYDPIIYANKFLHEAILSDNKKQEIVNEARKDVRSLINRLLDWYKQTYADKE